MAACGACFNPETGEVVIIQQVPSAPDTDEHKDLAGEPQAAEEPADDQPLQQEAIAESNQSASAAPRMAGADTETDGGQVQTKETIAEPTQAASAAPAMAGADTEADGGQVQTKEEVELVEAVKLDVEEEKSTAPGASLMTKRSMSSGSLFGEQQDVISSRERSEQARKLRDEKKAFYTDISVSVLDILFKSIVFLQQLIFLGEHADADMVFVVAISVTYAIALLYASYKMMVQVGQLSELAFVAQHGYSKKWKVKSTSSASGGSDPRLERDTEDRATKVMQMKVHQCFLVDAPWFVVNLIRLLIQVSGSDQFSRLADLLSMGMAGFGMGNKFSTVVNYAKAKFLTTQKVKTFYEALPADVRCASHASEKKDSVLAMEDCLATVLVQIEKPSFCIIAMTSNHDHEAALAKFREECPEVPYSGSTTCQGVLCGGESLRADATCIGIFAIYDPEGTYEPASFDYNDNPESSAEKASLKAYKRASAAATAKAKEAKEAKEAELAKLADGSSSPGRLARLADGSSSPKISSPKNRASGKEQCENVEPVKLPEPSFIWVNPSPGNEDEVLCGVAGAFKGLAPCIGGSSADNAVAGEWRQWSSQNGGMLTSAGCSLTLVWCSAMTKATLFTGYSPSAKEGTVTKLDGSRHIVEIDGKPAATVYNDWTGGGYNKFADEADANILGPSSLYPVGQRCGVDDLGEPYYRVMHPHLLKQGTKGSFTLFADVKQGEGLVMMSGTRENIVHRIAHVASHAIRSSGFSIQEVRGAMVIFCGGCMMYADDMMPVAAKALGDALGGVPHMGMHTFGEQGPFPDGVSRHGNLMFSAVIFSSKRRMMKLMNMDTGDTLIEGGPGWEEALNSGALDSVLSRA